MRKEIFVFGTNAIIDIDSNDREIVDEIVLILNRLDDEASYFKKDSFVSLLNNNAGSKYIEVSNDILKLIEAGIYYGDVSKGILDITFRGPGSYKDILIDGNKVMLGIKDMKIDFGAIVPLRPIRIRTVTEAR